MIKDIKIRVAAVFCDRCGKDVRSYAGWPYYERETEQYCPECAYHLGQISHSEWLRINGIDIKYASEMEIVTDERR